MHPRIIHVYGEYPALSIIFDDGEERIINLEAKAEKGGVMAQLAEPEYGMSWEIVGNGRVLRWPGEVDMCADVIYWDEAD